LPETLGFFDKVSLFCGTRPPEGNRASRSVVRFPRAKAPYAKPLRGFGDASVLEIVDDYDGDTFRAVYTVRFAKAVYVLHAFQKKSKGGAATPRTELDLIDQRLRRAKEDYEQWSRSEKPIFQ